MATGEKPSRRFQFTITDLLVISLACVLWVTVLARYGPTWTRFEDRFVYPNGFKPWNCVFFIVLTVLVGVAALVWANARGLNRSRRTGCLAVMLLLLVPFLTIVTYGVRGRMAIESRVEDVCTRMGTLKLFQDLYRAEHFEFATDLRIGRIVQDYPELAQAIDLPDQPDVKPYNGYVFRVLRAQGIHASGGKKSYVTVGQDGKERMTEGYAIIAIPLGSKDGIALMVSHDGSSWGPVYGKALGPDAAKITGQIVEFDPDESWIEAKR